MSYWKAKVIVEGWLGKKKWWRHGYVVRYIEEYSGKENDCLAE